MPPKKQPKATSRQHRLSLSTICGCLTLGALYSRNPEAILATPESPADLAQVKPQTDNNNYNNVTASESSRTSADWIRIPRVHEMGLCPNKVRAGDQLDGGWWICQGNHVRPDCVVYSFGIRDNFSFDHYMVHQHQCVVHGFDPSPDGLASMAAYELNGTAAYHSYGLGSTDGTFGPGKVPFRWPGLGYLADTNTKPWELKRLPTIMRELQTTKLTILKVDVEGAEWDMLPDLIHADWEEAYMELHFPPSEYELSSTSTPTTTTTTTTANSTTGSNSVEVMEIRKIKNPSRSHPLQRFPEQNVEPIDRIAILQDLLHVADVFHWDTNGKHCLEVYFVRKQVG